MPRLIKMRVVHYGYEPELAILQKWVETDRYQLLGLWGFSGTGKTLLLKNLAAEIQIEYRVGVLRSLVAKPQLTELLQDILSYGFETIENNSHQFF